MRKESTTIQKCNSRLTALGLNSDAAFHRSKLILKIYRDVVWVLSERARYRSGLLLPESFLLHRRNLHRPAHLPI